MQKRLKLDFSPITRDNVKQLQNINAASFPVRYNDDFYDDVAQRTHEEGVNLLALWKGTVVGAVCSRVQQRPQTENEMVANTRLYIMTLAVLAPYRGRGIGTQLVQSLLEYCHANNLEEIALHVQISNDDAIRFYTTRFEFVQGALVENYYRRIEPPHCYLLYRKFDAEKASSSLLETSDETE